MKRIYTTLAGLAVALLLGSTGCATTGYGYTTVGVSASYRVPPSARMVYVGNGLWVVADQQWPTFYSHGYYWLWDDGMWWRSSRYDRGWVRTYRVPPTIYRIDRPRVYVRYHVRPGIRYRTVIDHQRAYRGTYRDTRDWRDYRRDDRRRRERERNRPY